jgi:phenylpropionate dioxygenase-like ring-hydroxylating dioxygenase large terminal subunit
MTDVRTLLVRPDGFVPKERYTTRDFAELEQTRLWPRVWQIACREEQVAEPGDFVEYAIGREAVVIVRSDAGELNAFYNACLHRGRRLADGCGSFGAGPIRCAYHGWCYALDGRLVEVPDRDEFVGLPDDLALAPVRVDTWGGFVFVNLDPDAGPLGDFLDPLPALLGPYHLDQMRLRASLSTIIDANWKAVVDAFNEGYHVQGTHPQLLPWTDDVSLDYEALGIHAHYGRLPNARRQLRPSPRLGLAEGDYDEGEILEAFIAGLGGLFYKDESALVEEIRASGADGATMLSRYQQGRRTLLEARGVAVEEFADDQLTSADDVFFFPNMVGPIYPGIAIVFRIRPNGLDPDSCIKDTWFLHWPQEGEPPKRAKRRFFPDWQERDWGEITNQDYANMEHVQIGMKSRGGAGLRLNPRQESNILHMHRVIDRYLTMA